MSSLRRKWISDPAFKMFKKVLPPLSQTEKEAMEAGSVWWDGELFSGKPDFTKLHHYPKPTLSAEEQSFIDNELETLLAMLDDYKIVKQDRDLPKEVWDYLRKERFFSLIISKEYGGREFSALANSTIVSRIATRSISTAVTVMVPNSLGPGELLSHYGTQEQKDYWLPRLADGTDIPCFALTGPEAGSDAGSIPDQGVVCYGKHEGKDVLGIRLSWNKRYITLAPVATVLGLAFKLSDPEHLLGDKEDIGITCALIPASHEGVEIGERHDPLGLAFMNGPTRGQDVFIPMDWLIGGADYAGKGWRMLVECLSAGRGISLPALGTAIGHLTARTTGAYGYVRKQFGMSIGKFEGVAEAMGRIGGLTYLLEATRTLTTTSLDLKEKPGIVTAIAKYHMTEIARTILNDAMDIHSGRAIQDGPMNYLATHYLGVPVAITVEGANILTRNLMIFGQGATRCHPYVLKEMEAAANPDQQEGAKAFDELLFKHIAHATKNSFGALFAALTGSRFIKANMSGPTQDYYKQMTRLSRALAVSADVAMLTLGGELKRKEMISARLGDALSYLYMGSAVLKKYEDEGRHQADLDYVHYAMHYCLHHAAKSLNQAYRNYPVTGVGAILKGLLFPLGNHFAPPSDELAVKLAESLMTPGAHRDRLTALCYIGKGEDDSVGLMEKAFLAMYSVKGLERKLQQGVKEGKVARKGLLVDRLAQAEQAGVLSADEVASILAAEKLRSRAIQVDHFSHDFSQIHTHQTTKPKLNSVA
ncbi:acyl-CoA dehydrogenase [Vibrio cholerae]|uniref:Acyl-coenzyme A dehydrogenase n=1 Tax=Vibrio cholerae TaxID=666 RepID=A0A544NAM6_VIBCL|nr:acyl-CoA dehydrogenase [Vibrio cholerae]MCD6669559.1 acyl-CoA dehydrogenase [Vibrio cholerae]TQP07117.1 acyl-CoA dehydrogenase [Vibrio cholerae]TQP17639.1 acyl-CoA dehydrogenase [Vibrio cholerae]TQP18664.1 acyl-CoA dehydrogenase [Vibrio cholerae]TQP70772.1 acyl-CoA dehydrogenase [Vibrio cholerae]